MYTRPTKATYRLEAKAWRWLAAAFCRGEKSVRYIQAMDAGKEIGDGLCIATEYAPNSVYPIAENAPFEERSRVVAARTTLRQRMLRRLDTHKPKKLHSKSYWFSCETEKGRMKRIAVALKCAAQCDKLAGDK